MRWPWFRSRKRQEEPETEWWERLRRLEGDMQQLQLEWERTYAKVRQALASLGKRQAREDAKDGKPEVDVPNGNPAGDMAEAHARLRAMYGRR